jgi:CRISPR-associated protein Csd1
MRQTQRHFTKLKQEDSGAFFVLERKLQELCSKIDPADFPPIFSLEEQGQFALGYYHQKQKDYEEFKEHQNNKLKSTTEEE